jgi:dihydrofolate reductase
MSMSLDGFITGPHDGLGQPLGEGGERLQKWIYGSANKRERHDLDVVAFDESSKNAGAVVMGRRMFDVGEGLWGDTPPFHGPVYVVTHQARQPVSKDGGTTFFFVTEGVESAVDQAQAAAGDQDVWVAGGANVIQQSLKAGLLDELQLHLIPVLLGDGRRLFDQRDLARLEMACQRVVNSPGVTHLQFEVIW